MKEKQKLQNKKKFAKNNFWKTISRQKYLIYMVLPGIILLFIFNYVPMYGVLIAFKKYNVSLGVWGSPWVGLKYFQMFFHSPMLARLFGNTFLMGFYTLLFGFPAPIILALLLNEINVPWYKKAVQTVSYIPYFISTVIIVGMLKGFCSTDGLFNDIRQLFHLDRIPLLAYPQYFRSLFVGSGIWQSIGWGTIIYLAAVTNVNMELYDAAKIDGANRFQQVVHITWQAIKPTTFILLILNLGGILSTDYQKVLLMYNSNTYETADVIGTYVYREGILGASYEYTTAIGLLMTVISFILVFGANQLSRRVSEYSLW